MKPTEQSVWRDQHGIFYLVKFVSPDDDRIILSRFQDSNFITTASYLEGMELVWPRPALPDAVIDRIAERLLEKVFPRTEWRVGDISELKQLFDWDAVRAAGAPPTIASVEPTP